MEKQYFKRFNYSGAYIKDILISNNGSGMVNFNFNPNINANLTKNDAQNSLDLSPNLSKKPTCYPKSTFILDQPIQHLT